MEGGEIPFQPLAPQVQAEVTKSAVTYARQLPGSGGIPERPYTQEASAVQTFERVIRELPPEEVIRLYNSGEIQNTATVLIGVQPGSLFSFHDGSNKYADWVLARMHEVNPKLTKGFDTVKIHYLPQGETRQVEQTMFLNRSRIIDLVNSLPQYFSPVTNYEEARIQLNNMFSNPQKRDLAFGLVNGYRPEDCEAFAQFAGQILRLEDNNGERLMQLGYTKRQAKRTARALEHFDNVKIAVENGNILLFPEFILLKMRLAKKLGMIAGLDPQAVDWYLNSRTMGDRTARIFWVGYGQRTLPQGKQFLERIQIGMQQTGMKAALERIYTQAMH
jgi:hypothetical protein